jgi:hypothetical protein
MGNQPSKTATPNKLSKPKTNTNSTGAALKTDSPTNSTRAALKTDSPTNSTRAALQTDSPSPAPSPAPLRHVDLSAEGRQQIREALLSPINDEFGSAVWAQKEDEIAETTNGRGRSVSAMSSNSRTNSRTNSKNNSRTNSRSNSLSCFGSRYDADSQISLASPSTLDLQAAIELLQKVKKNASPEDLAALQEVLEAPEDDKILEEEPTFSRRASAVNRTLSSLTRRQSIIQTPGVGTRNSPIEGRRRTWNSWKSPQVDLDEESKWRSSPRLHSFRTTQATLMEDSPDTSMPRAQTPSELDYAHLGSLKLGTLVVTNGAPSPANSMLKPRHAEDDDYSSATEVSSSPLMMKSTRQRGHVRSRSATLPQELDGVPIPYHELPQELDGVPITHPDDQIPVSLRIVNRSSDRMSHSVDQLAQSYQAEIPTSPFLASEESRNQDEGFTSDGTMDSRNEEALILQDTTSAGRASQTKAEDSKSSYIAYSPQAVQQSKDTANQRPPVRTVDSGYSSSGSVRIAGREQQNSPLSPARSRYYDSPQGLNATQGQKSASSPLRQESFQSDSSLPNGDPEVTSSQPLQTRRRSLSLKFLNTSASCQTKSPLSESLLSPATPKSAASQTSFDTTSSKTRKRFHRSRSSQSGVPVVQSCQPIPEGTIPEVPTPVRAKFERRVSDHPGVECLTHTYPSKDHVVSEEHTTDAPIPARTEFFAELEAVQPPTPPTHGRSRSRSLSFFRRKSTAGKKEDEKKETKSAPLSVVGLGTIASSLGTSPYDAAIPRTAKKTVATDLTHPHQLGNLPRSKSLVRMDSNTAVEFARMHSKDLTFAERQMPQPRRRSFHNLRMEAGEANASKLRPQSSDIPPVPIINFSRLTPPSTATSRSQSVSPEGSNGDLSSSTRSQQLFQRASQAASNNNMPQQESTPQTVDWEAHSKLWSQRRKSLGEGLRPKMAVAEVANPSVDFRKMARASVDVASWDRFSGGLQYNYEGRGIGIGGSAGTRSLHSHASSKSMHFKASYGVDLSDVPIMVQRI